MPPEVAAVVDPKTLSDLATAADAVTSEVVGLPEVTDPSNPQPSSPTSLVGS